MAASIARLLNCCEEDRSKFTDYIAEYFDSDGDKDSSISEDEFDASFNDDESENVVDSADKVTDPEAHADAHVRQFVEAVNNESDDENTELDLIESFR